MDKKNDFIIIGAAIMDILTQPVNADVFTSGSMPANHIATHTGGDAMNEATVLAGLGASVRLVSKIGQDSAGSMILQHCKDFHIDTSFISRDASLDTGINIVLIDDTGERYFITTPNNCQRKFYPADVTNDALLNGKYLCFASIFVAPAFDNAALRDLFSRAKAHGLILCADMTKRKNKETVDTMKDSLSLLDYIFPNYEEASLLTGLTDYDEIADAFLACGVGHVVLKTGSRGCFIKTPSERYWIAPYPDADCLDTTGAGDTFTACFLYALNQGMSLPECGRFANAGASICIEHIGATGWITMEQTCQRYQTMLSS